VRGDRRILLVFLLVPLGVGAFGVPCAPAAEVTPETLLREALYQEQTLRQPDLAAQTYRKLIAASDVSPAVRGEAHLRLGLCLERVGQADQARRQFELVLRQFADQPLLVEKARQGLDALLAADPATLMPPESLLYVELLWPGRKVEQFIASLKRLDEPGLEVLLSRFIPEREIQRFRDMVSQAVREDLTHIDSVAIAGLSWNDQAGWMKGKFLLVLHPGRSFAARGFLSMLVQTSGKPSGSYRDVKLWDIPDGPDGVMTFASLTDRPGLGAVMLLGKDRRVVCDAIDRHQAGPKAVGLASQPEFRRQAGARRRESALLVYADVPKILDRLEKDWDAVSRAQYQAIRQLLALETIERGMARVALLEDGLLVELSVMFNEKPNPFYGMWRTPPADLSLLGVVPNQAAAALLLTLGEGRQKLEQTRTFMDQVGAMRALHVDFAGKDPLLTLSDLEQRTGLSFAEDLIGNCRSLAVILPSLEPSPSTRNGFPWANLVLALRMAKPDEFARLLERALLDRLKVGLDSTQIAGVQTWTYAETSGTTGATLSVARMGDVFLFTLSSDMLHRVLQACKAGDVMERSGPGRPVAGAIPSSASKVVIARPDLLSDGLRALQGQARLGFTPARPVVLYTIEQPNQMVLRAEVGDLTNQLNNVILAAGARLPASGPASTSAISTSQAVSSR
jgi:hypothetical protein